MWRAKSTMALLTLIHSGHDYAIRQAIGGGTDLETPNSDGVTPLHVAVMKLDFSTVNLLIKRGVALNAQNKWGRTPLWYASKKNSEHLIKLLVEAGADINLADERLLSPLAMVVPLCGVELVRWFVENGADVGPHWETDSDSDLLAIACGAHNWDVANHLLDTGFVVKDSAEYRGDLMYYCINRQWAPASDKQHSCFLWRLLEECGFDPNHTIALRDEQWTCLHEASYNDDVEAAKLLILAGANIHAKTANGDTPASIAGGPKMREFFASLNTAKRAD